MPPSIPEKTFLIALFLESPYTSTQFNKNKWVLNKIYTKYLLFKKMGHFIWAVSVKFCQGTFEITLANEKKLWVRIMRVRFLNFAVLTLQIDERLPLIPAYIDSQPSSDYNYSEINKSQPGFLEM